MKFFAIIPNNETAPKLVVGETIELSWKVADFYSFFASLKEAKECIQRNEDEYPEVAGKSYWIAEGSLSDEDVLYCISCAVLQGSGVTVDFTILSVSHYTSGCLISATNPVVELPADPVVPNTCYACGMG